MKLLLYPALMLAALPVGATTYCPASSADLELALLQSVAQALAVEGSVSTIKLRNDVDYVVDISDQWTAHFDEISLLGGYVDESCSNREQGPDQPEVLLKGQNDFSISKALVIEDVQLRLESYLEIETSAAASVGIRRNSIRLEGDEKSIINVFRGNTSAEIEFTFSGNVLTTELGLDSSFPDACALSFSNWYASLVGGDKHGVGDFYAINNTIAEIGQRGICVFRSTQSTVANNIILDTPLGSVVDRDDDPDSDPIHSPASLRNNILEYPPQLFEVTADEGNIAADPMFDDALSPAYQLQPNSPAVNSGWMGGLSITGNLDLLGNPRRVGSTLDRGAFESSINDLAGEIVVTSNADSGPNTLRQAILSANGTPNTAQRIVFDLGAAPTDCGSASAILLESPLPEITDDLEINGYEGVELAAPNSAEVGFNASLCVVLSDKVGDGVAITTGLVVPAAAAGTSLTVKGIDFRSFSNSAVALYGGANHVLQGNSFGIGVGNSVGRGVFVDASVPGVLIGGYAKADRNHLGGATSSAIQTQGDSSLIVGNLIGPGRNGSADIFSRNQKGIVLDGDLNIVAANTISGNLSDAVLIQGNDNIVQANLIGYNDGMSCQPTPCTPSQGNLRGVRMLGDDNQVSDNQIGFSSQSGVIVATDASGNAIRGNSIRKNAGLGIDLRSDGVPDDPQTADVLESASTANLGQNFPGIISASGKPRDPGTATDAFGSVTGKLISRNGTYVIELFASESCDVSGHGEGEEFVGSTTVKIINAGSNNGVSYDGSANFAAAVSSPDELVGRVITATARSAAGNTSEFSTCLAFVPSNTAPSFDDASLVIAPETTANTSIALLHATDDGLPSPPGKVTFTLLTADVPFSLSGSGELIVTQTGIFEAVPEYELEVLVDDGQGSTIGLVTVRPTGLFRDGFETLGL